MIKEMLTKLDKVLNVPSFEFFFFVGKKETNEKSLCCCILTKENINGFKTYCNTRNEEILNKMEKDNDKIIFIKSNQDIVDYLKEYDWEDEDIDAFLKTYNVSIYENALNNER